MSKEDEDLLSPDFVSPLLSKVELLRRLKVSFCILFIFFFFVKFILKGTFQKLSKHLSDASDDAQKKDYTDIAAALVQPGLLTHKSKDIQIHLACCLVDIFRIFAPDAPYEDKNFLVS